MTQTARPLTFILLLFAAIDVVPRICFLTRSTSLPVPTSILFSCIITSPEPCEVWHHSAVTEKKAHVARKRNPQKEKTPKKTKKKHKMYILLPRAFHVLAGAD